jgi:tRNA nucleotidyltransferase (CCA-adding enzyme)
MQVILTHEQADFDAIASLLGASLLQKEAFVVLPSVMNRNVQSFIHLYGADLPFIKSEDLPNEPITAVTLVDTQSLVTLKGMRKDAQVCVIDHHQKRAICRKVGNSRLSTPSPALPVSSKACRKLMVISA